MKSSNKKSLSPFVVLPSALALALMSHQAVANESTSDAGYYGSLGFLSANVKAEGMENSLRPGIGSFVEGDDKDKANTYSLALGYDFGNNWRLEGEYTATQEVHFTSDSSTFAGSLNNHYADAQRVMFNVYRDMEIGAGFSAYATGGLGVAKIESSGWQGVPSRQYHNNTDTNLIYAVGVGVGYEPIKNVNFSLGYRYVDLGKVESGMNAFVNSRGLQDEQLRAHLYSSEYSLTARYSF
ncbi:porin family protein [Endozoicomonas sp. 4G]|uniref:outer membrane protein n=1 Tax=Endozoicomonas sp. 4G TaxID=2872754 RepID=UPI0020787F34|nr:porin family protein [Endozoicomonas sp. 4G]